MKLNDIYESQAMPRYYFAYGMLTDPKVMGDVPLVGPAVLNNFEFELIQYANVFPQGGSKVYGALWRVNDQIISELDQVEGYPNFYDRKTVPVICKGKRYVAEVYTMTPESREWLEGTYPSESYIKKLVNGYRHAGIPTQQISQGLV
jgi:gamma-glutamylcyclotransferase (GGCT)/AIG2-like uncharacterized protein YtfP